MSRINIGKPLPLGSSITKIGVNFSLVATSADFIEILIFEEKNSAHPKSIYKLDEKFKSGPYWHAEIEGLAENTIYAYRVYQKNNHINNDYYGGYMLTLSINNKNKEYLYSSAMMGAGEILEGPVGSRGSCKKF